MQFRDAAWEEILSSLAQSRYATPPEENLHQQACSLSTNPGFNTLLCLQVARNFTPYPYQVEVAREVMQRMRGRAMLCDEVGLGKTIEAGLIITEYILRGLARKVLVLCPTSLASQWAEELRAKFGLDFVLHDEPRFQNHPAPWKTFDRIIASLDMAKREPHRTQILETFFDCVVVDEAHRCRNRTTLNWKFINELKKKYILLLTATPVQNDLEELYNLITLLRPGQLQTASSFASTFITRGDRRKPKNAEELRRLTREVMIRNRRSTVGLSLPKRTAETILVNPTAAEAELYRQLTDYVRQEYNLAGGRASQQLVLKTLQREVGSSPWAVLPTLDKLAREPRDEGQKERLTRLVQLAGETKEFAKGQSLIRLLHALKGEKAIVFTNFRHTQEHLAAVCRENGLDFAMFHGEMRRQEKEEAIADFAADIPVLISSESGGEGRNLQFCHIMINFDLPWNPMRIEQRIGRIHRIGQTHDVRIYNLAAAGTVESYILSLLDTKINMFELVVGELDMILGELAEEKDFEDLIMDIWAGSHSDAELAKGIAELGDALARSRERYEEIKQHDLEIFD
ncbi:MAG: DEAD/DEAH box helicase [Clostridia bacterium]|nr:MAG: DEAD/DEAH box helicase [Clostridia bacterium]